jgi:hypothetical protein
VARNYTEIYKPRTRHVLGFKHHKCSFFSLMTLSGNAAKLLCPSTHRKNMLAASEAAESAMGGRISRRYIHIYIYR